MIFSFPMLTAEEAAALIEHGQTVGFSGFTPAGAPKAIPMAIADAGHRGASGRPRIPDRRADRRFHRRLARWRAGQGRRHQLPHALPIRSGICASASTPAQTRFFDMHLSLMPQVTRYGFLGPVHWAVVEACDVTAGGGIVLTSSVGAAPTFLQQGREDPHRTEPSPSAHAARHARYLRAGRSAASPRDPHLCGLRPHRLAGHQGGPAAQDRGRRGDRPRTMRLGGFSRSHAGHREDRAERGRVSGGRDARRPHARSASCRFNPA